MKKIILILLTCILLLVVIGCTEQDMNTLRLANPNAVIPTSITDNGFKLEAERVNVNNYRLGTTAEAYYFVTNDTENTIIPSILLDTSMNPNEFSYIENKGYEYPPDKFEQYIEVEQIDPIPPGELRIYTVSFNVPKKTEVPDKWAFRTILAGNTGGQNQVASWVWWIIDMR